MSSFTPDRSGFRCALCLEDILPLQNIRISETGRAKLCSKCFDTYCKYGHGRGKRPSYDPPLRNTVLAFHRRRSALGYLHRDAERIKHMGKLIACIRKEHLPLQALLLPHPSSTP